MYRKEVKMGLNGSIVLTSRINRCSDFARPRLGTDSACGLEKLRLARISASRRSMDRMAPSEGADVGSIPAERTNSIQNPDNNK
jgi:hypothetical protein